MGIFNLFGRNDKEKSQTRFDDFELSRTNSDAVRKQPPINVFKPTSFNDV